MHMAMICAAIANDGDLMMPCLVDHVENDAGITVSTNKPRKAATLFDKEDCAVLKNYMRAVVTKGTGYDLKGAKYEAAGKTGTAEYSSDKNKTHSWFVGYANVEDPEVVVAVVVEDADGVAPGVSRKILDAYYSSK